MVTGSPVLRQFLARAHTRGLGRSSWRLHPVQKRWKQTTADDKPYYITTPIFYVNAEPHVGHLYTSLLADVLKRWQVLKGDTRAALLTGTDEHGMKVQKAAEKAELTPKALCDKNAEVFEDLFKTANVAFDRFIRTTDTDHKTAVEYFWRELRQRDYIYESKHEGWYSVSDETFYPESQVHLVLDPATGRKHQASMETGKEVEWTSEVNYHFRLSAFRDRLLEHYRANPSFIVPEQRFNFIRKEVEAGLQDLSVSRPSSRLHWGIPVPDDESQTIYVWLDALINYATMTGYPWQTKSERQALWPPNVQVIGKDIIRFHTIYWPAFLMALDLPIPKQFLTHAHWTMNSQKMSKSTGNGVNPFMAIDRYGLDAVRYFMIHDGGIADDADYDNSYIVDKYKKGLQGGIGNLVARTLRTHRWDVGPLILQMKEEHKSQPDQAQQQMQDMLNEVSGLVDDAMQRSTPGVGLKHIMNVIYRTNQFVSETEPWSIAKKAKEQALESSEEIQLARIVFFMTEATRIAGILLQPVIPGKAAELLDKLGVQADKRTLDHARYGADFSYGQGVMQPASTRSKDRYVDVLFPPLQTEF